MKSEAGTYALILKSNSRAKVQIGCNRQIDLEPGYYIYVGSAFGPGGVKARVSRHLSGKKRKHWHIDYLLEFVSPFCVWYNCGTKRLEHQWAQVLHDLIGMTPIGGFGCSDCNCYSHLFITPTRPDFDLFTNIVGGKIESYSY